MAISKSNQLQFHGAIQIKSNDNVATLIREVKQGDIVKVYSVEKNLDLDVRSNENIPRGHKIALIYIKKGEKVIKYGETIGITTANIKKGDYVHVHNLDSIRGKI